MRILVTGGAGFIGSHLVRALLRRGDTVRVLDDLSTGRRENLAEVASAVELVQASVASDADVARAVAGMDAIVHQAAQVSVPESVGRPAVTAEINVGGTARLLTAAARAGARRFVLASSCAVYGDAPRDAQSESDVPRPMSPYAASKLAGERLVATAAHRDGLQAIALRYFNVYGARQRPDSAYAAAVPAFASAMAVGRQPVIFGDGQQTRDLCHVDDVVRANLLALEAPEAALGRAFNVGSGVAVSVNELVRVLGASLGRDVEPVYREARAGDLRHSRADLGLARAVLGFEPAVNLRQGLALTVPWYVQAQAT